MSSGEVALSAARPVGEGVGSHCRRDLQSRGTIRGVPEKIPWRGPVTSVQPRIRLLRSFDQRSHSYLGYVLRIDGEVGSAHREFTVAVGKAAHAKHEFNVGFEVTGEAVPVPDPRTEPAEFYKASKLKVIGTTTDDSNPPPWQGAPPPLELYRERGHRRLAAKTFDTSCSTCIWGARMPTEMTIDQWNPSKVKWRFETHCYGPMSCRIYKAGPTRKVPGRKGMSWEEEDWVDEDATAHRGADE